MGVVSLVCGTAIAYLSLYFLYRLLDALPASLFPIVLIGYVVGLVILVLWLAFVILLGPYVLALDRRSSA